MQLYQCFDISYCGTLILKKMATFPNFKSGFIRARASEGSPSCIFCFPCILRNKSKQLNCYGVGSAILLQALPLEPRQEDGVTDIKWLHQSILMDFFPKKKKKQIHTQNPKVQFLQMWIYLDMARIPKMQSWHLLIVKTPFGTHPSCTVESRKQKYRHRMQEYYCP